jgi:ectoine hydroxylase-related dioxygenase (phytanoyl-CoA dioxygenase family)
MPVPAAHHRLLDEAGWVKLDALVPPPLLARLAARLQELFAEEGERAGSEFKQEPGARRLANLVDKGAVFREAMLATDVLEHVGHVLGTRFKLSSLNARAASPGGDQAQPLHVDAGALPDARGYWVCNALWMLDDFTADNGPLRVVPGTHRSGRHPREALSDPQGPHPDEVLVTGCAGDVVVMNGHLWHGGLANRTAGRRLALHAFYCRWDKPQQQYQKALLRAETQAALTPAARALLALDDADNDALAAEGGRSGFMK